MYLEVPAHIEALGLDFGRLWRDLTAFPTREEAASKIRIYSARTLANLDSQGRGPAGRLMIASKVCYPKDELVMWYAARTKKL